MKKLTLLVMITLGCCLLASSCKWSGEEKNPFLDYTLAESISFSYKDIAVEALYDGVPLDSDRYYGKNMDIKKLSDTEVSLFCNTFWDDKNLTFEVPRMSVSGVPYKATFDYTSDNAKVIYDDITYYPTITTIKGWITEKQLAPLTRDIYIPGDYIFEVKLNFTFEDGKELSVRITPKK